MYSKEDLVGKKSIYHLNTPTRTARDLFLYPTAVGRFKYLPGYSLKRNRYDSFLIIFIESGTMEILLDEKYQIAREGSVVMLNCYKPHAYRTLEGCTALWIHFDGKMARNYYKEVVKEKGHIIAMGEGSSFPSNLNKILASFDNPSLGKKEASTSLLINNLLLELCLSGPNPEPSSKDAIKKATTYIQENFDREISLNELASIAGFSPYYFSRKFKRETGLTPHQFLLSTRIDAAKYNLSNTNMTIKEIANSCGFEDESAFCYCFRKRVGCAPGKFKSK